MGNPSPIKQVADILQYAVYRRDNNTTTLTISSNPQKKFVVVNMFNRGPCALVQVFQRTPYQVDFRLTPTDEMLFNIAFIKRGG